MKTKTTFLKVTIGLALAIVIQSCSISKNGDFSQQKYTKFHKGAEMAINNNTTVNKVVPQKFSTISSVSANPLATSSKSLVASVSQNQSTPDAFTKRIKPLNTNSVVAKIVKRSIAKFSKRMENTFTSHNSMASSDDDQLLLLILAILLPPLAIYIAKGICKDFWIDLIFALLGFSVIANPIGGIAFLIAIIYAVVVVLQ